MRNWYKKPIQFLVLLLILGSFLPAYAQQRLKIALPTLPSHLHPLFNSRAETSDDQVVNHLLWQPLLFVNSENVWQCGLCDGIPLPGDKEFSIQKKDRQKRDVLTINWKIKKNQRWGDKAAVTAKDFVFTWEIISAIASAKGFAPSAFYEIESLEPLKNEPLKVRMEYFLASATYSKISDFFLLPSHLEQPIWEHCQKELSCYEEHTTFRKNPTHPGLYNGTYLVKNFSSQKFFRLQKSPMYSESNTPEYLELFSVGHNAQLSTFDVITERVFGLHEIRQMQQKNSKDGQWRFYYSEDNAFENILFNLRNPIFSDVRIREALFLATDREDIVKKAYYGAGSYEPHMFYQKWWPSKKDHKQKFSNYDPEKAKEIFNTLGWHEKEKDIREKNGQRLQLELIYTNEDPQRKVIVDTLQEQWKKVGVELKPKAIRLHKFTESIAKKADFRDLLLLSWTLMPGVAPKSILHSKEVPAFTNSYSGQNLGAWRNHIVDQALDELDSTFNEAKREELVEKIIDQIATDYPFIGLSTGISGALSRRTGEFNIGKNGISRASTPL